MKDEVRYSNMKNHWHHEKLGWKSEFVRCCHCKSTWTAVFPANLTGLQCPNCKQITGIRIFTPNRRKSA